LIKISKVHYLGQPSRKTTYFPPCNCRWWSASSATWYHYTIIWFSYVSLLGSVCKTWRIWKIL